jgi:hypothetical protein
MKTKYEPTEEITALVAILSHPAGFDVDICGTLIIRPIDENSPPQRWEVDWEEIKDNFTTTFSQEFSVLSEAVSFFVQKRRELQLGLDFEKSILEKGKIK